MSFVRFHVILTDSDLMLRFELKKRIHVKL
jgi:hypothetical protein